MPARRTPRPLWQSRASARKAGDRLSLACLYPFLDPWSRALPALPAVLVNESIRRAHGIADVDRSIVLTRGPGAFLTERIGRQIPVAAADSEDLHCLDVAHQVAVHDLAEVLSHHVGQPVRHRVDMDVQTPFGPRKEIATRWTQKR